MLFERNLFSLAATMSPIFRKTSLSMTCESLKCARPGRDWRERMASQASVPTTVCGGGAIRRPVAVRLGGAGTSEKGAFMSLRSVVGTLQGFKPGGHLPMTTHAECYLAYMTEEDRRTFRSGRVVILERGAAGSNLLFTAHPPEYVKTHLPPDLALRV